MLGTQEGITQTHPSPHGLTHQGASQTLAKKAQNPATSHVNDVKVQEVNQDEVTEKGQVLEPHEARHRSPSGKEQRTRIPEGLRKGWAYLRI